MPVLLEDVPLHLWEELWVQQDGAPPHFGRKITKHLHQHFQNGWIGRQGPTAWPPMSPDLTLWDYYFWGRTMVYPKVSGLTAWSENCKW